jgi:hypothetical protein
MICLMFLFRREGFSEGYGMASGLRHVDDLTAAGESRPLRVLPEPLSNS